MSKSGTEMLAINVGAQEKKMIKKEIMRMLKSTKAVGVIEEMLKQGCALLMTWLCLTYVKRVTVP